jgi:hypothetical protein
MTRTDEMAVNFELEKSRGLLLLLCEEIYKHAELPVVGNYTFIHTSLKVNIFL